MFKQTFYPEVEMKRLVLLFICYGLLGLAPAAADMITVSGNVSGVWSADTVLVTDDIRVSNEDSLIIEPGVSVLFQGNYQFDISGYLLASGTVEDSIKFMPYDSTLTWQSLHFNYNSNDMSLLEFCLISQMLLIHISNSNPTLRHCTINRSTGSGVFLYYSN